MSAVKDMLAPAMGAPLMGIESTFWNWALPFSGSADLSNYHPMTDWSSHNVGQFAEQFGFINIYAMASDDPHLEQGITRDVASYGMQLFRVIEALHAICHNLDYLKWDSDHKRAMENFMRLADEIEEYKRAHQSPALTQASIKDSIERLITLLKEQNIGSP